MKSIFIVLLAALMVVTFLSIGANPVQANPPRIELDPLLKQLRAAGIPDSTALTIVKAFDARYATIRDAVMVNGPTHRGINRRINNLRTELKAVRERVKDLSGNAKMTDAIVKAILSMKGYDEDTLSLVMAGGKQDPEKLAEVLSKTMQNLNSRVSDNEQRTTEVETTVTRLTSRSTKGK